MASKRLLVDVNVLLELLLPNRSKTTQCEAYLTKYNGKVVISILSVHIVYYFCRKYGYSVPMIDAFLTDYEIAGAGSDEYNQALSILADTDLEDAMQVAVAKSANCDTFLTIDKNLAKNYSQHIAIVVL